MPRIDRFTVSLDSELLAAFDHHISTRGYTNRSEAVRDLIRDLFVASAPSQDAEVITGYVTGVVDHATNRELAVRLRKKLLIHRDVVVGTLTISVDDDRDGVAIALRGKSGEVHGLANRLRALGGFTHGHFRSIPVVEAAPHPSP